MGFFLEKTKDPREGGVLGRNNVEKSSDNRIKLSDRGETMDELIADYSRTQCTCVETKLI